MGLAGSNPVPSAKFASPAAAAAARRPRELNMPRWFAYGLLAALLLGALGAPSAVAGEFCDAPVPPIQLESPASAVPSAAAAFAGVWRGVWPIRVNGETLSYCARFYITVVDGHKATVEHCNGSRQEARLKPQCSAFEATIDGDNLSFIDAGGNTVSLTLADVGGMLAEWSSRSSRASTQFVREQ